MQYSNLMWEMTHKKEITITKSYLQSVFYNQLHIDQHMQGAGRSNTNRPLLLEDASASSLSFKLISLSTARVSVVIKSQSKQR